MPSRFRFAFSFVGAISPAVAGCASPPGITGDFENYDAGRVGRTPPGNYTARVVASLTDEDRSGTSVRLDVYVSGNAVLRCEERSKWGNGSDGVIYPLSLESCKWMYDGKDDAPKQQHCKVTANPTTLVVRKGSDEMTVRSPIQLRFAPDQPDSAARCGYALGVDVAADTKLDRKLPPRAPVPTPPPKAAPATKKK